MANFPHKQMAERFAATMDRAGATVDFRTAGSGTVYVTVDGWFKVRFADHGECYCSEILSVDPDGCTLEQAVRAAGRECDLNVSRSLASFKAAATRAWHAGAEARAERAENERAALAHDAAKNAFQAAWLAENCPDYDARSSKSRKRARAKANAAFEAQYV